MSTRCARGVVAALIIAAATASAQAQTVSAPSPSPSPSAIPEIGRVTTSDRRTEPIGDTSRPTFVIDRAQIEAYGARSIADALQGVPGVELFHVGTFGAEVDYGIRGSLPTQTLVMVDGIPVTDPTTGAVPIGQLSTIGVQRIEIVESGSSTLYGSNASGGVINIITSVPRGAYLAASTGSFGDRDLQLALGDGKVGGSFERHVSTGDYPYPAFAYGPGATFPGAARYNSWGELSAGRIGFDSGATANLRVRARLDLSASVIGAPGRLDSLSPSATQATTNTDAMVDLAQKIGAATVSLTAAGSQHQLSYIDPNAGGESDVYTGRSQVSLKGVIPLARFDLVTGIDIARESGVFGFGAGQIAMGSPPLAVGAAQSQAAAYAQLGFAPYPHSRIVAGLRAENDGGQGSVLDPSFGGALQFGALRLAGNLAETFRVPTLQDLYFPGFSNPALVPERAQTSDVTLATQAFNTTFSFGWFARGGSNFIVFDPVQLIPINEQRAAVSGLAVTANVPIPGNMVFAVGLTDLYQSVNTVTGMRLPRSPVGGANLSLAHSFGKGRFEFGARWNSVGDDGDDKSNVTPLTTTYDAYNTLDAYLRYKISPQAVVSARGFNLGNTQYAPIYGYPAPGRSWMIELSTR